MFFAWRHNVHWTLHTAHIVLVLFNEAPTLQCQALYTICIRCSVFVQFAKLERKIGSEFCEGQMNFNFSWKNYCTQSSNGSLCCYGPHIVYSSVYFIGTQPLCQHSQILHRYSLYWMRSKYPIQFHSFANSKEGKKSPLLPSFLLTTFFMLNAEPSLHIIHYVFAPM